jgi:type IV conjugative transfer system protein TraE
MSEQILDFKDNKTTVKNWKNLIGERKILMGIITVLVAVNSLLVIGLLQKETEVHLVPSGLDKESWVSTSNASKEYKEMFGLMVAKLAGNVNPGNVDFIAERLSKFAEPEIYNDFKISLYKEVELIKLHRSEQSFIVKSVSYDKSSGLTYVTGTKITETPDGAKEEKILTYKLKININQGMPTIAGFWVTDGNPVFEYQEKADEQRKAEKEQRESKH